MSGSTIVLATGGTGGHLFPAEALAEELEAGGFHPVLVTDNRARSYPGTLAVIERHTVRSGTFGRSMAGKVTAAADVSIGIVQALALLRRVKPQAVVGFGGYPSFPTVFAANKLGIPTIVHEQNSVLGRANRWLVGQVRFIATTFATTRLIKDSFAAKTVVTGNPVRASIRALHNVPYPALTQDGQFHILVTGGSQGAGIFSQIVPSAIGTLPRALRARIRVDQQCREGDLEATRAAYQQLGVSADLSTFFADIPARLASAHLVIARAGASTIAELTTAGRPSLLVPLPGAMDNHQYHNANALEESGAGWMMPQEGFTAASLAARLESFMTLPESLIRAAGCARKIGHVSAASDLASLVRKAVGKNTEDKMEKAA